MTLIDWVHIGMIFVDVALIIWEVLIIVDMLKKS